MNFPKELTGLPRWVCWRLIPDPDGGKDRKVPFNPATGKKAAVNRPQSWTDYDTALSALGRYGYSGLGFVFAKEDEFVGVDIDHCCDPETHEFNAAAAAILSMTATYAEFSPSGTGVHLFFRGLVPGGGRRNTETGVEMYGSVRYFTMTGNKLPDAPDIIAADDGVLLWIYENFIHTAKPKRAEAQQADTEGLSDEELLKLAAAAANGPEFGKLWNGQWQNDYPSRSEADFALCRSLAFWSGRDKEQMDRLFRRSGLMRPKYEQTHYAGGVTYGEGLIGRACERTGDVYTPPKRKIYESGGAYYLAKGDCPLTNFIMKPLDMITIDDETQLTADCVTESGETFRQSFMTVDFACPRRFKTVLNRRTLALSYTGTEGDLEPLKTYIHGLDWRRKTGVKAMGIHAYAGGLVFVSASGAVDAAGAVYDEVIQPEKYRGINSAILKREPVDALGMRYLGARLMSYNEPAKTVSVLAWICGCFIKEHLRLSDVKFPHLMLIGEAGSGKSTTLERVVMPVFSGSGIVAAGQTTGFTLMRDAASSNLVPMALDEFKPSKLDRARLDTLLNHFRNSYDVQKGIRGRPDLGVSAYDLHAPLAVAGEESADEAAVRERTVELLFSKKDLTGTRQTAFRELSSAGTLGSLGRSLLGTALSVTPERCLEWYESTLSGINDALPSRIRSNLACLGAGLELLQTLCTSLGLDWNAVFPHDRAECLRFIEYAAREYLLDGGTSNKSVVDQTLEIMSRMGLDPKSEYAIIDNGTVLALRLNVVYDKFTRYCKDYAIKSEILTYSQFRKQLEHAEYFIEKNAQKRIGSEQRRVYTLNYAQLTTRCDVSGFEICEVQPM